MLALTHHADAEYILDTERLGDNTKSFQRFYEKAFAAVRQLPGFIEVLQNICADGGLYKVIISKENIKFFKDGVDGITRTTLRNEAGQFVENVNLIKVGPNVVQAMAQIQMQICLLEICAKLDKVIAGIDHLADLIKATNNGALRGALDSLSIARKLRVGDARRSQILQACGEVGVQIGAVAAQIKVNIAKMSKAETTFWDGWLGDGIDDAENQFETVHHQLALVAEGMKHVVDAYVELGEFDAARHAYSRIWERITEADLDLAFKRARLLPFPQKGPAPEEIFRSIQDVRPLAEQWLSVLAADGSAELVFPITMKAGRHD